MSELGLGRLLPKLGRTSQARMTQCYCCYCYGCCCDGVDRFAKNATIPIANEYHDSHCHSDHHSHHLLRYLLLDHHLLLPDPEAANWMKRHQDHRTLPDHCVAPRTSDSRHAKKSHCSHCIRWMQWWDDCYYCRDYLDDYCSCYALYFLQRK